VRTKVRTEARTEVIIEVVEVERKELLKGVLNYLYY
jgi:hypothetical protein